jgi:hypothetical protein
MEPSAAAFITLEKIIRFMQPLKLAEVHFQ